MEYVGGDEEMSEIERDKLSLQEVKGFLRDHIDVKESMKLYFLLPGKTLSDGLVFLHNDSGCVKIADYTEVGGVADIFVEYHGEEESVDSSSGSDFEDEIVAVSDDEPDVVITAEPAARKEHHAVVISSEPADSDDDCVAVQQIMVPDDKGVVTAVINSPVKPTRARGSAMRIDSDSDSEADTEYMPHSEDSGEDSEVVELRKHARKFKKRMRDTKSWIGRDLNTAIPINLIANMEEQIGEEEQDWSFESSDEDYSYDEDSDGKIVRRKSKFPRFNNDTEVPHFQLSMVFRSKNQLCKAIKRHGLVTKRSISFMKSEIDRVRAKCDWPGCKWMLYAAKTSKSSRFQVITFEDVHHCAQNRENRLVTGKVIAQRYEHFILANPMWKIESMKATVLQDMFADVTTSKCKHAKKIVMDKLMCGMKNEYTRVFDYQLELLRSNPGSTVAVCLDPSNRHQHIFQSFYVCFNALKQGFRAGCRRVVGLDGCFFKGAVKGELLCAIGRDANNQMYPLAWAVVEQETNETWKWFVGLLIKDLDIFSSEYICNATERSREHKGQTC